RPWLAGGKANEVFLSTDTEESGHEIFRSTDAGASCSPSAIADNGSTSDGGSFTGTGKLFYDHIRGNLVEPVYYTNTVGAVDGVGVGILPHASAAFSDPAAAAFTTVHV